MKLFFIFHLLSPPPQHKSDPWSHGEGGRRWKIFLFYFTPLHFILCICVFIPHLFQKDFVEKNGAIWLEASVHSGQGWTPVLPSAGWAAAQMLGSAAARSRFQSRAPCAPAGMTPEGTPAGTAPGVLPLAWETALSFNRSDPSGQVRGLLCVLAPLFVKGCPPSALKPWTLVLRSMCVSMINY